MINVRTVALTLAIVAAGGCASTPPSARDVSSTVGAAVTENGTLGNAPYRVEIPDNWNGELVMLLHGYEPAGFPRATPWPQNEATPVFLSQGFAVAESAYSSQGWSVSDALVDNEQLRSYFTGKYGKPARAYLVGFSLGGHVALASLEKYGPTYDGALSLCGINIPAAVVFDEGILTPLVAFDYLFPGVMGLAPGGLSDPESPPMLDPETVESALAQNESAAAILVDRLQIRREYLAGALMLNYMVLREAQMRSEGFPADNTATAYTGFGDDAAFNNGARRYTGDQRAMRYIADAADLTGRVSKPVVLQSNNNDPTVPKRFHAVYPRLAAAAGHGGQVVSLPPVGEGHCDFSPEQILTAFGALTTTVPRVPAKS